MTLSTRIFSASLFCVGLLGGCADSVTLAPHPGTEASLQRYINSLEAGQPNYDEMTPRMASVVREELPTILASLKPLGPLQSITYQPGRSLREDKYLVTFEHGKAEWTIGPLTADGKVDRRGFQIIDPFGRNPNPFGPDIDPSQMSSAQSATPPPPPPPLQ